MKHLLLLFAICLCLNSYAKEQTKTFTIKKQGYVQAIIQCRGNFEKGVLSDGPVKFYWRDYSSRHRPSVILEGIYCSDSTYTFWGTCTAEAPYQKTIACYGTIINDKDNRIISKKSSAQNWEINLQFYAFIGNDPQIKAVFEPLFLGTTNQDLINSNGKSNNFTWEQLANNLTGSVVGAATVYFPDGSKYIGPIYWGMHPNHDFAWWFGESWERYGEGCVNYRYFFFFVDYFEGKIDTSYGGGANPNPLVGKSVRGGCFQLVNGGTLDYKNYNYNQQYHYSHQYYYYVQEHDEYLEQYPYPSLLFPILKERQRKDDAELKQQELKKQQEEAYARAKKEALQREEQLKKEREQRIKAEQRKAQLIQKYGSKWGVLLAMGKLELGMTKQMCQEVVDIGSYDISKHVSWGRNIETWSFNYERDLMELELTSGIYQAFGITPRVRKRRYSQLEFTDGVLTAIN